METTATIHASNSDAQCAPLSKGRLWTGRIMSALPALFLFVDAVGKLVKPAPVVEGTIVSVIRSLNSGSLRAIRAVTGAREKIVR